MKKQDTHKKGITIALVSGKGGVGKTSICLVMGSILSHLGKKVLLMDFDIATHGMTYFILEKIPKGSLGIIELLRDPQLEPEVVHYETNYHVLPSTTELKTSDIAAIKNNYERFSVILKNTLTNLSNEYDYILIDCQAGATDTVRNAIEISAKVLIVAEADPISVWAIKKIEYEFGKILPHETFGLINKLFLEEKKRYKDIVEYSRLMKFLPPLPFDMEVRRKFARRLIPSDIENPTEFLIGLCYAIRDLLPEMEKDIDSYLKQAKVLKAEDLKDKLAEIESVIELLRESTADIQLRKKYRKGWLKRINIMTVATLGMVISIFSILKGQLNINIPIYWVGVIGGMLLAGVAQLYLLVSVREKRKEKETTQKEVKLQVQLDNLIERKKRLEVLLMERERPFL